MAGDNGQNLQPEQQANSPSLFTQFVSYMEQTLLPQVERQINSVQTELKKDLQKVRADVDELQLTTDNISTAHKKVFATLEPEHNIQGATQNPQVTLRQNPLYQNQTLPNPEVTQPAQGQGQGGNSCYNVKQEGYQQPWYTQQPQQGPQYSLPVMHPDYLRTYYQVNEDSKYYKLQIKEYDRTQYIQEWVQSVTPIIKNRADTSERQKNFLANHLPSDMQTQVYQEASDPYLSYEAFCESLYLRFGMSKAALLQEFLSCQIGENEDVKTYIEKMIKLGTASQQDEQAIICTIRCRLPDYITRYLGTEFYSLYQFKNEITTTLRNPTVDMYRRFTQLIENTKSKKQPFEKKENFMVFDKKTNTWVDKREKYFNKQLQSWVPKDRNINKVNKEGNSGDFPKENNKPEVKANMGEVQQNTIENDDFQKEKEENQKNILSDQLSAMFSDYLARSQENEQQTPVDTKGYVTLVTIKEDKPQANVGQIQDKEYDHMVQTLKTHPSFKSTPEEQVYAFVEGAIRKKRAEAPITSERNQGTQTGPQETLNRLLRQNAPQNKKPDHVQLMQMLKEQTKKPQQHVLDYETIFNERGELLIENLLRQYSIPIPILTLLRIVNTPNAKQIIEQLFQSCIFDTGHINLNPPAAPTQPQTEPQRDMQGTSQEAQMRDQSQQALAEAIANFSEGIQEDFFAKLPLPDTMYFINKYKEQLRAPKAKLFCLSVNLGNSQIPAKGVLDTGCTTTLMPLSTAKKVGVQRQVIKLDSDAIELNGVGGNSNIIGIVPNLLIKIGETVVQHTVGIIEKGDFDILLGNDITADLQININAKSRQTTYQHPVLGTQVLELTGDKSISQVNANFAITTVQRDDMGISQQTNIAVIKRQYQNFIDNLEGFLPGPMVNCYKTQFYNYTQGKNLKAKQLRAIQDFCLEDTTSQEIQSLVKYPQLNEIIHQKAPKYDLILVDPPWQFKPYHQSEVPYRQQEFEDLLYLPVTKLRRENSLLLMWTIGTHMFQALNLLNTWDYKYVNILIVWRKVTQYGNTSGRVMGWYTRINCEYLLLGTYGTTFHLRSQNKHVNQYVETYQLDEQAGEHSAKPQEVYEVMNQIFNLQDMSAIELFARDRTKANINFDLFGDQLKP